MFRKYQHIERLNDSLNESYLIGNCYVFPKIDGTNSSVWLENGKLKAGSRNRELSLDNDNANFFASIKDNENILKFLQDCPNYRLFGEWLVPHTLKNYKEDAWKKFYVFDVVDESNVPENADGEEYRKNIRYLSYEEYSTLLNTYSILYLPVIIKLNCPDIIELKNILSSNGYLTTDGNGEGIVIKNYDYINRTNTNIHDLHWIKIISKEFLSQKQINSKLDKLVKSNCIEETIVENFVTESFIEKEYAKIINDNPNIKRKKLIPMLLNIMFHELIEEESWNIIKKYKCPTINYKVLKDLVIKKIKSVKYDLF